MDKLKIKVRNTELEIPLGLLIGVIVILVSLILIIFGLISLSNLYDEILQIWRDIKR